VFRVIQVPIPRCQAPKGTPEFKEIQVLRATLVFQAIRASMETLAFKEILVLVETPAFLEIQVFRETRALRALTGSGRVIGSVLKEISGIKTRMSLDTMVRYGCV
jgi:hypothetical protein